MEFVRCTLQTLECNLHWEYMGVDGRDVFGEESDLAKMVGPFTF
jgi:hypothetical protein